MRASNYISKPSQIVQERINEIAEQRVRFIIDPKGPSKFIVKPIENKKESFTVSIGTNQICTCNDHEICIHILYVMIRYFGVPKENDILWQKSLTDYEIDNVLNGRVRRIATVKPQPLYRTKSGKSKVKRLPIGDEDVCPICYDSLKDCDKNKIAWCRRGCGGNFHRKCVKAWIDSRKAYGEQATCPLCRQPLDVLGLNPPPKKPPPDTPPPLTQEEIRDLMTRELSPDDYDLLLRLDQHQHTHLNPPLHHQVRPKSNIKRTKVQIISPRTKTKVNLDLQITGKRLTQEQNDINRKVFAPNHLISKEHQNHQITKPFSGEIKGIKMMKLNEKEENVERRHPNALIVNPGANGRRRIIPPKKQMKEVKKIDRNEEIELIVATNSNIF
ncbi:SWIM zinc finger family protein [Histomonas meleagridis]|uniref:SWIM zinc finger family protein n=1 Tax=Histomonas meleagridis TaxID=135588 RepID=UPI0035595952|nr:SWIM zinc finger family protein [Histomonas meleagridis]KAH0804531.1 SWIM zinc finger family protein [Histomonas meleagridis]